MVIFHLSLRLHIPVSSQIYFLLSFPPSFLLFLLCSLPSSLPFFSPACLPTCLPFYLSMCLLSVLFSLSPSLFRLSSIKHCQPLMIYGNRSQSRKSQRNAPAWKICVSHKLFPFQPNLDHSYPSWHILNLRQSEACVTWVTGNKVCLP